MWGEREPPSLNLDLAKRGRRHGFRHHTLQYAPKQRPAYFLWLVRNTSQERLACRTGGLLDQELQEPQGLHQNQNTSKGPPDFQGNQKAKGGSSQRATTT